MQSWGKSIVPAQEHTNTKEKSTEETEFLARILLSIRMCRCCACGVCVCEKSLLWADSFSASSHAHEVPPSYCCFYTIFLYVWFTCDAASYIPKALTRRQQQIATNNSAFFSLFFSLRSFVFVSCVLLLLLFSMCVGKTWILTPDQSHSLDIVFSGDSLFE